MNAKMYTETVTRCIECPAYDSDCTCALCDDMIHIDDSSIIQSWCPLEDV